MASSSLPPSFPPQAADILRQSVACYEKIVQEISILRRIDDLDETALGDEEFYSSLLEVLARGLFADNCSLMLWDEERNSLELRCACSFSQDRATFFRPGEWTGARFESGQGIVGRALETGVTQSVPDVMLDPEFIPVPGKRIQIRSLMCIPLRVRGELFGALNLSNASPGVFDIHSEKILELISSRMARLIRERRNAILLQEAQSAALRDRKIVEQFFELNPYAIGICDPEGHVVRTNAAFRTLAMADLPAGWNIFDDPVLKSMPFYDNLLKLKEGRITFWTGECCYNPHDLTPEAPDMKLWLNSAAFPVLDDQGQVLQIIFIHENVTPRKRVEEELQKALEETEEKVQERGYELEAAHREVTLRNAQLTEINQELTAINAELSTAMHERTATEMQLRQSEQRYRSLVDNATEGIAICQDDKLVFVNSALCALSGYTAEELAKMCAFDLIYPEDREWVVEVYMAQLAGDATPQQYEFRAIRKDGEVRWAGISTVLIEWEGKPATLDFYSDVSERKRASQELKESQNRFFALAENTGTPIFIIQGVIIVYANPALSTLSGYRREELIGNSIALLLPPEQSDLYTKQAEARQRGETVPTRFSCELRTKSGAIRHCEITANLSAWDGKSASIITLLDMTPFKEAGDRELANSRFLQQTLDSIQESVVVLDRDQRIQRVNAHLQKMCTTKQMPLEGKFCYDVFNAGKPCQDCPCVRAIRKKTAQRSTGPNPFAPDKTGWAEFNAYPLLNANQEVTGVVEMIRDVSRDVECKKRLERQLKSAESLLRVQRLLAGNAPDFSGILELVGEMLDADSTYILALPEMKQMVLTHKWESDHADFSEEQIEIGDRTDFSPFRWLRDMLKTGQALGIPNASSLPHEATSEKAMLLKYGYVSNLSLPLQNKSGGLFSIIMVNYTHLHEAWTESDIQFLHAVGDAIATPLEKTLYRS